MKVTLRKVEYEINVRFSFGIRFMVTFHIQEIEISGDCTTNYLKIKYFSSVSQINKERLYCQDSQESLKRIVSSSTITVEWRTTEASNSFKLDWFGNCGGGFKSASGGVIDGGEEEDKRCDWTLDADTYKNVEYEITVLITVQTYTGNLNTFRSSRLRATVRPTT